MTTGTHKQPDWKVTTGHRVMVKVGWGVISLALYFAVAAEVVGLRAVWWIVAALALVGVVVALTLPEPVPRDLIMERERWVDARRPS